jgi:hypothetical protein
MKSLPLLTELGLSLSNLNEEKATRLEPMPDIDLGSLSLPIKEGEIIEKKELTELWLFGIDQSLASSLVMPKLKMLIIGLTSVGQGAPLSGIDFSHLVKHSSLQRLQLRDVPLTLTSFLTSSSSHSLQMTALTGLACSKQLRSRFHHFYYC